MKEKFSRVFEKIKQHNGILDGALLAVLVITLIAAGMGRGALICIDESAALAAMADLPAVEEEYQEPALNEVYAIVADGNDIIYMMSEDDAGAVLAGITERYRTSGSEIKEFALKEDVSIEKREFEYLPPIFSVDDAVNYIVTGASESKIYIVKGGDNLWDIAIKNGIKPSELEEMNPGLNPKRLQIGMEIYLYQVQPFISVAFKEVVRKEERVAYNVIYEDDNSMYKGQVMVKSPGEYGTREVVSEVTKENGVVVGSVVLSETMLSAPVAQIALRGTMPAPVYTGTSSGYLTSPLAVINVTSAYGNRGGALHKGVDLKAPRGTPIYASADGVVTFAGSSGSYGNIVKLSHGDGLETYYAHCDTIIVTIGEVVAQGQQIATIGRTGNATCDHVHYEVKINGVAQNPMNYI